MCCPWIMSSVTKNFNSHSCAGDVTTQRDGEPSGLSPVFSMEGIIVESSDTCQSGSKKTILLVEDEAWVRRVIGEVLQSAGYRVVVAESATQALAACRDSFGQVDLLLADVVMPGICGRALAQKFLILFPNIRIMLMSGYAEQLRLCELSPQRKEYLAKPFSISTLLKRVRELLDRNPVDFGPSDQLTLALR